MADEPWLLKEDGYLNVDPNLKQIIYHPSLNVILICTDLEVVHVLDVNSGVVLQSSRLSAQENSKVTCRYLTGQDRVLFCDGYGIGVRSDYNGVLLLDTILQKPVANPRDIIKLELLLSEAILLKQNLILMSQFVIDQQSEVINELCDKIAEAQKQSKKGIKAQKWNTVCLELPLDHLKRVAEITVTEFTLKNQHVPELAVAAAVQERLNELLNDPPAGNDRSAMASEARRRDTFSKWPHMDYKWALPDQMAQAGFYHQPNSSGDDRAMCFTCTVCLVCWERTDEPWSEHERHSPNCPFVMGEYTQNVPLSVTHATAPALDATYRGTPVTIVGSSGVSHLVTTANADGLVTVYDVTGKLKRTHSFYVTQYDSPILECCMQEFGHNYSWSNLEDGRSVTITSLSVVGDKKSTNQINVQNKAKFNGRGLNPISKDIQEPNQKFVNIDEEPKPKVDGIRPAVICGLTIKGRLIDPKPDSQMIIEDLNARNFTDSSTCLCLVVYDFQYTKDIEREPEPATKKSSSTTSSNTKSMSNIVISMINDMDYTLMDASNSSEAMTFINDMNYQALKMLKQTESNNYQNLIPGESDDIFLPPPPAPNALTGTRVLVVDDTEEPDASSSVIAPNYQFMNGQLEASNTSVEKSISDHITDLKSSKNKKLNYSHAVQCIAVPAQYKNETNLEIFEILPTRDGTHLLVVLRSTTGAEVNVLLVYSLCFSGSVVKLNDKPVLVRELSSDQCPVEVSVIPSVEKMNSQDGGNSKPLLDGSAVIVCADGVVRIFDLATLKPTSVAKLENEKFVSAVYCNSLERLCAATPTGSLHFYALNEVDTDFTDEHEDEDYLSSLSSTDVATTSSRCSDSLPEGVTHCFQHLGGVSSAGAVLGLSDLRHLHSLCAFEPLSAQYCVVVPPCWSEMQQAQRQRRHPQYLSGDEHHTRTWRLQTDTTTWDEHIFELTLPWPVSIGHMDVHFSLHGQHSNPPHVEVTLLRQNTTGIGHRRTEVHFQVDEGVSFECLQRNQNPVTSREYLRSHNADILAGPINLANCLDLSEQNGCVTLTSPKLFKTNTRTLLLHIKALCDPSKEHTNIRKEFKRNRDQSSSSTNVTSNVGTQTPLANKAEYYMGCDCLHELSITIYKARNVDASSEKIQRSAMLESNVFLATLLRTVMDCSSMQRQSMAFDVMIWVTSIRLARNRGSSGEAPSQQVECLRTVELGLETMFKQCLLNSGRSIAHKCVKLIVICSEGARNISDPIGQQFDNKVLQALLQCLPEICKVWSAGALHWLVVLILRVTRETNHQILTSQCVNLLRQISHEMNTRTNPYHLLLRTRFGLFGTPLEPELFDIDPPPPVRPSSIPVTYASVVTGDQVPHSTFQNNFVFNDALEPKDVFVTPTSENKGKMKNLTPNKHMRGLLETEPLHFACVAASDGTRVERFDPNVPPVNMSGLFGPVTVHAPQNQQNNTGTKKADSDDIKDKENVALTELDINLEPSSSSTPKDAYPKELTQFIINADIHKATTHDWPILANKLDVLEMTIDDDLCTGSEQQNNNGTSSSSKGPTWGRSEHIELLSPQLAQCSLQQLLVAPPQQVMVVERMQSGARRFVTLDFGAPVLLTDVIIPACHDLVSLSLDLWLRGEDADAVRLVLATDIGSKTLVLSDLQPPPICRYIKITTIGRYGMSTTRCKIPIGNFYGHIIVLPDEIPPDGDPLTSPCLSSADIDNQMNLLAMLLEDVSCRYSLACSRLKDLLHPLLTGDIPNPCHMAVYMNLYRDSNEQVVMSADNAKVFAAYNEATMYQKQLNVVQGVIRRIEHTTGVQSSSFTYNKGLTESCTDKLRVIAENLLDIVLSLSHDVSNLVDRQTCEQLFQGLCVPSASRLQMLTATLLVRSCGRQSFWGDFLSDTIAQMYTASYTTIFPIDRVFMLLNYLGKKSPERSIILDANMRVLAEILLSFQRPQGSLLAVNMDLSLLGWILLFLSWQIDHTFKGDSASIRRWNWVTGDTNVRTPDTGVCTGSHRRKVHRRFIHYKQQIDQLDWTKKAVQASTQALSALSSQAASLSSKLEAALKQQEHVFKRIKQISSKQKEIAASKQDSSSSSSSKNNRGSSARDSSDNTIGGIPLYQILEAEHSLGLARAIVTLLLAMDHSCSADLFLLACKVLARLVVMSRLSICQIISVDQLQQLMRQCVRGELPWAQHALSCLLLDMLEVAIGNGMQSVATSSNATSIDDPYEVAAANVATDMDTDSQPAGPSWGQTDTEMFETFSIDENIIPEKIQNQGKSTSNPLPSVFESDDSELDDFLDDILERGRSLLRRNGNPKAASPGGSISSAMDARLELGVESTAEIMLRRLTTVSTCNVHQLSSPMSETNSPLSPPPWPDHLLLTWSSPVMIGMSNSEMLSTCFNTLFNEMQLQSSSSIEHTVRLWLTLNKTSSKGCFNPSVVPTICISTQSVNSLVSALVYSPSLSLRTWCVALQALTLICNIPNNSSSTTDWLEQTLNGMAGCLIGHQDFVPMLLRLLSGSGLVFSDKGLAGPSVCRALHDLLIRLLMRCDVITAGSSSGVKLKELLLQVLYQMVQLNGPLATRQGPLDVQCKFLQSLLHLDYADTNLQIVLCILESTGVLVSSYVSNVERIKCVNLGERNNGAANNFSGLFASVLGSDSSKQDRPASWESLLIALLKLLTRLVQTPLPVDRNAPPQPEAMDTETVQTAQTDESKAERQQEANTPPRVPCLADTVLQRHPSIMRLCHSLASCSGSSLAMLVGCAQQIGLTDLGEPTTVGDAVFQLLSVMTQKTSRPELILEPLVMFLRAATQLSEPLLWFMLQVLNTEEALRGFLNLDGVRVLAESMVRSGRTLTAIHHGHVSLVMHHIAQQQASQSSRSDATLSYAAPSFSKKVQQANLENAEALVNFAPMGSIRCHSGTAQPADVLIQSAVASHRRARTPQWCYHFYPDETHTDLTIRLPSAVLLREVQLQPHLSSLSTCPSAVALEVSNGSPDHLVPASPPLPTSGMTFIRLHLPVPEVVTHVLLRLYKPRDASNIGLSQIRLLGTSAFGAQKSSTSISDVSEEEQFSKFSLGWLRLLHHCFTLPQANSDLEKMVIASAASVPDLLFTCCGLLLVPSHIPTLYLPNLERVLCKLSLFDRMSGLNAIRMLLDSKSALSGSTHVMLSAKSTLAMNSPATQSVCELLHQVCGHQDQDTPHRVSEVLQWLQRTASEAISQNGTIDSCSASFISCIASVLWSANETGVSYTLHTMVTKELFDTVFRWCQITSNNAALKNALDCLLCSLCYIKTELFPILLQRMGVLVPNLSTDLTASISDDRKDSESMTDDNKQSFENESEWYGRLIIGELSQLILSEAQLATIAMVSRSPPVIQQLLDSGLPKLLIRAILDFSSNNKTEKVPMARLENVTAILKFLADVCAEQTMRDWLGSPDGSIFWLPLLQWLCKKPSGQFISKLRSEAHAQLEEVCVRFLSKCCLCHRANQRLLAKVLCDVISQQFSGISGFMRRLVLQLLLENEKVFVCIKADESVYKISPIPQPSSPLHPLHKRTHDRVLLQLSTNTTIGEILEQHIAFATTLKTDTKPKDNFGAALAASALQAAKEIWEIGIDGSDHISMAAGVTAKDKRAKDVKNQSVLSSTPQLKKKRYTTSEGMSGLGDTVGGRTVRCESLPEYPLPLGLTLAQLLALLESQTGLLDVHLTISHSKDDRSSRSDADSLLQHRPIGNALQVFSTMGGLALLAQHLPTVYPEIARPPSTEKSATTEQPDTDWVKVEGSDDIYEDLEDMPGSSTPSKNCNVITNVPPHSLTAFGLFLRLPGYAEVLLKDTKKALCLLRLVLGVTDDGEGGDIFLSPVADTLPTLPFEVLRQLYDTTPLGTDDGRVLRTISINIGVTHLLLACLAVFTHQIQPQVTSQASTTLVENGRETTTTRSDDKSQLYWAKGTGFGTGSTQQSWNVEQALLRQRSEEEHVTVLLQVLASYINPGGRANDELADANVLPAAFEQQLANSCLLPALSSYLRNDSVLDMARHIPLYRSVLQLLRAMALSQQLVTLLLPRPNGDSSRPPSIVSLLLKMKSCVDNYTCRLRFNKNSTNKLKFARYSSEPLEESETDEGLALLMPDIQETANLVQQATSQIVGADENDIANRENSALERPLQQSLEQRYLDVMRRLQFDTFEMITESPDGYKFVVSYHFEGNVRSAGDQSQPARVKRLAQEAVTLATSLPLSYSSSVFVRCDTDRLDIMKVLITGPADTPYANGCFELDVYFPPDYPNAPMLINLETTGHHTVRFNPNLYNDGKVCLSVLNTWHGRPEEKWNAQTSSFLQVLVSIQSLILVPEPYFNEPGYERSRGTPSGTQSSREYNTNICQATVRWAMLEQIMNPCPCFKDVIHTHFWLKRHEILAQVESWIQDMEAQLAEKRSGRTSSKRTTLSNLDTFKKNYHQLRDQLAKLTPPEGLEDLQTEAGNSANANGGCETSEIVNNDIDTDIDMEKLVSEVCE